MGKSLRSIDIQNRSQNERPDAVTLFTDRTDPQEAFERKFHLIEELRDSAFGVLCYYGIGGIGKTSLMNRLMRLMKHNDSVAPLLGRELNGYPVCFDFGAEGISIDKLTVLKSFRNQLAKEVPDISFYLFDTARALYYKRLGIDFAEDGELSSVIDKNVWLKTAVNAVGAVPVVGWVSNLMQAIDVAATDIYGKMQKGRLEKLYENELSEMYALEAAELLSRMHRYFAKDLEAAVCTVIDRPIVFFLDTYEEFVDTLKNDTVKVISDYWLRKGPDSLIQSVPGALWVITGREKLTWRADDDFWGEDEDNLPLSGLSDEEKARLSEEALEQHLLGDLSDSDAKSFFRKAGIKDEKLAEELYALTHGTPIYLDLCVERYYSVKAEREPVADDFGKDMDELVNRYLKNMPDVYREMACVFSLLGSWNDEMISEITKKAPLVAGFSEGRYREFLSHSFVIKNSDGNYYLHDTVKRACEDYSDNALKEKVYAALREYSLDNMEEKNNLKDIASFMRVSINNDTDYETAYGTWKDILKKLLELENNGDYDSVITVLSKLYSQLDAAYRGSGYMRIASDYYAYWLCKVGRIADGRAILSESEGFSYKDVKPIDKALGLNMRGGAFDALGEQDESVEFAKQAYELVSEMADDNEEVLKVKHGYAVFLVKDGQYKDARQLLEVVYEKRRRLLGGENLETLKTAHALASAYRHLGDYEKSLRLFLTVYDTRKKCLGENHPATIGTLTGISGVYSSMDRHDKALNADLKSYEYYINNFGEAHPKTITCMKNIAIDYEHLNDYNEAYKYVKMAYERRREAFGEDDKDTVRLRRRVSELSLRISNYK